MTCCIAITAKTGRFFTYLAGLHQLRHRWLSGERAQRQLLEGHVPADAIKKSLLAEHPDARGLTVPTMLIVSPGINAPQPRYYRVLLLEKDGTTLRYPLKSHPADLFI
jgi:hypothetical protein